MNVYTITHEGKTQAQYEAELKAIAKSFGFKNASGLQCEYTWRAVIIETTFAGCKAIITLAQTLHFNTNLDLPTKDNSGRINAYIVTPNGSFAAHGVNLENFNADTIALKQWSAMVHPITNDYNAEMATRWFEERAEKIFEQWWDEKLHDLEVR